MRQRPQFSLIEKQAYARDMRDLPTEAEANLWECLRCNQLGFRFRRQITVWGYIVDFWCPTLRMAIEVDGSSHSSPDRIAWDAEQERAFAEKKIWLLRFTNRAVLAEVEFVLLDIRRAIGIRAGAFKGFAFTYRAYKPVAVVGPVDPWKSSRTDNPVSTIPPQHSCGLSVPDSVDTTANQGLAEAVRELARQKSWPSPRPSSERRIALQAQKVALYRRQS